MGLFTKEPVAHNNNTAHTTTQRISQQSARHTNSDSVEPKGLSYDGHTYNTYAASSYRKRPNFGQWLKHSGFDILTLAAFGALALGIYFVRPTPTRDFPLVAMDGHIINTEIAYPIRKEIIPIWAAALIGVLAPMFVVLVMSVRVQSFWDCNNAFFGILYSTITAGVIQVLLKWLIGGFAPNFLELCQPELMPQPNTVPGVGFRMIYFNSRICQGDPFKVARALESFPDGKTTVVFAGLVFLTLYLNAKLKVMANYHPAMWKLIAMLAPILGAVLVAGTNTIDHHHHWYDCLAGALIGTLTAFISFRMVYASVFDFRFNHIPLNRSHPCKYGGLQTECTKDVFTHQAGWLEAEGTFGGAPWDSRAPPNPYISAAPISRSPVNDGNGHGHQVMLMPVMPSQEHVAAGNAHAPGQTTTGRLYGAPTVTVNEVSSVASTNSHRN